MRLIVSLLVVAVACVALWFSAHWYAQARVRAGFAEAGMSDKAAACMGRRLSERLTLPQLYKLTALKDRAKGASGWVDAVEQMDDPRIVKVTGTSALLCSTGLAR